MMVDEMECMKVELALNPLLEPLDFEQSLLSELLDKMTANLKNTLNKTLFWAQFFKSRLVLTQS